LDLEVYIWKGNSFRFNFIS